MSFVVYKESFVKRIILFLFIFISSASSFSQKSPRRANVPNLPGFDMRPLHFGFLLGLNTMDFDVYNNGISTELNQNRPLYADIIHLTPGINIGIVSDLRLHKYWNVRFLPGISFGQRDLYFVYQDGERVEMPIELKSTFLEFPLLVKYSSMRLLNFKPYLIGGVNGRIDLARSKKENLVLKPYDICMEFGVGIDYYLNYFRLSTEIKASYGMFNVLGNRETENPDDMIYQQALDKLTSNIFHFTFYFE